MALHITMLVVVYCQVHINQAALAFINQDLYNQVYVAHLTTKATREANNQAIIYAFHHSNIVAKKSLWISNTLAKLLITMNDMQVDKSLGWMGLFSKFATCFRIWLDQII